MKFLALIKKEFHRFFHDPRLIVTMLLPGIVISLLYSMLGTALNGKAEARHYRVYCMGSSAVTALISEAAQRNGDSVEWLRTDDENAAREEVREGKASAILVFSENFDAADGGKADIIYDASNGTSSAFYSLAMAALNVYGMRFTVTSESLTNDDTVGMQILCNILPLLIVAFVFSACMSVTLESVAGEKERGTLSTILVTSAKRSHIALGKIFPLACISMLGALSSFLGTALSMPKLMGLSLNMLGTYGFWNYFLIFLLIVSFVPLIVSLIAVVSTYSKSVKEASAYTGMLMIFSIILTLVATFVPTIGDWAVAIPVLNAVAAMQGLLAGALPVWQSLVSVGVNLAFTAIFVFVMTKMLSDERIMFGK